MSGTTTEDILRYIEFINDAKRYAEDNEDRAIDMDLATYSPPDRDHWNDEMGIVLMDDPVNELMRWIKALEVQAKEENKMFRLTLPFGVYEVRY